MILCWLSVKRKKERNKQTKKQIQVVDCRIIHFWLSNCHLIIWWSDDNKGGWLSDNSLLIIWKQTKVVDCLIIHCYFLCNPGHAIWVDNAIYADTAIYAINTMPFMQTMPLMPTMPFLPSMQCQLCIQCRLCNTHNANCAFNVIWFLRQCQMCVQCHLCNPYNAIFGLDIEK